MTHTPKGLIVFGDNLAYLETVPDESVDLIYIDPPFNTGRVQSRLRLQTIQDDHSPDRFGFKGRGYRTSVLDTQAFDDKFDNFQEFITPRLEEAYRVLKPDGSLFFHIDYREVHYCKLYLDDIFGRDSFINEIIWAYDYGARSRTRWSPKHDNILWYAKDPECYAFNYEDVDRIPYMAPSLVGAEKAARGKVPSDTWWHTIVSPTGKEKTGYPTQKPLGVIERIVRLHSVPGDTVLDFFAGSGTVGEACGKLGRDYILVDNNPSAISVMRTRLSRFNPSFMEVERSVPKKKQQPAVTFGNRVHVIGAAVWNYDEKTIPNLRGPKKDAAMVREMFSTESTMGLYNKDQVNILENPTLEELRQVLTDYVLERTATGDILIFYFSGHGMVNANGEFGFCLKDVRARDSGQLLPISILSFRDVLGTLQTADIHPVFIIDACFSASAALSDNRIVNVMQDDMQRAHASSYALFCACYSDGLAVDMNDGGAFTRAIYDVAKAGLSDSKHKQLPVIELGDLTQPVQTTLEKNGMPVSRVYKSPDLPNFPLIKNVAFSARTETFAPYFYTILELMWNGGTPRMVSTEEIRGAGAGAYGNHSKLSLSPWALVEDGKDGRERRLTERGKAFISGELAIPSTIVKDPDTDEWHAAENAKDVKHPRGR